MKKTLGLLALSLAAGSAMAGTIITDPDNGHYYEVISDPGVAWITAETAALGMSYMGLEGHLATVTSSDEDGFVGQAVAAAASSEYWLGGFQNPANEQVANIGWTWVNNEGTFPGINGASGSDNSYSNWNPGEPNDAQGPGSEQFLGINLGNVGGFNDEGDLGLIGGYVVEFDPNTVSGGGLPPGFVPDSASTSAMLLGSVSLMGLISRRFRK